MSSATLARRVASGLLASGALFWSASSNAGYIQVTPGYRAQASVDVRSGATGNTLLPESVRNGTSVYLSTPNDATVSGIDGASAFASADLGVLRVSSNSNPSSTADRQIQANAIAGFMDTLTITGAGPAQFTPVSLSAQVDGVIELTAGSNFGGEALVTSNFSILALRGKVRASGPGSAFFKNDAPNGTAFDACRDSSQQTAQGLLLLTSCSMSITYSYTVDTDFSRLITTLFEVETGSQFDFGYSLFVNSLSSNVGGLTPFTVDSDFTNTSIFAGFGLASGVNLISNAFGPLVQNGSLLTYQNALDALGPPATSVPEGPMLPLVMMGLAAAAAARFRRPAGGRIGLNARRSLAG